ncbi:hypothetical protein WA1_36015 [Scytonema hofmannii PCC 7110]|uniref:EF-hand domain-containing protein n=1 Tax=Scytonema hofmannii PCC 7110 TaxID=128403 RepID=A0A139X1S9_9CYAN|nr:EF-hand domain-containing protein [Scytonema hofmannii]KYC38592.1 hypothetical protein WA1_36015 [Scytonema hofmannii PCC 7110]
MLADKTLVSTSASTFIVFASDAHYAPAMQLMSLLTDAPSSKIRALKRFGIVASANSAIEWLNINTVSLDVIQEYFRGAETAFVFIMPTDLSDVNQLTRSLLEIATEAGVRRFAWVAPACGAGTELGSRLTEAANLVRSSGLETLVLTHAPLLSDLLEHKKELKFRRTLSLPLGNSSLPWLAPDVIANGLYKWVLGELNNQPPELLTGSTQLIGQDIARGLSDVLTQTMNPRQFAQLRFQAIDLDRSGHIDAAELFPYLLDLAKTKRSLSLSPQGRVMR